MVSHRARITWRVASSMSPEGACPQRSSPGEKEEIPFCTFPIFPSCWPCRGPVLNPEVLIPKQQRDLLSSNLAAASGLCDFSPPRVLGVLRGMNKSHLNGHLSGIYHVPGTQWTFCAAYIQFSEPPWEGDTFLPTLLIGKPRLRLTSFPEVAW